MPPQSGSFQWLDAVDDSGQESPGSGEDIVTQTGWGWVSSTTQSDFLGSGYTSGDLPEDDSSMYGSGEETMASPEKLTVLPQVQDTLNDELLTQIFAIITMVIAVVGTVGNVIAIFILHRRSLKHIWISAFLTTLCLADTVALWAYFVEVLAQTVSTLLNTWMCKIVVLVSTSAGIISSWSIVAMCVHLALNVTDPFIGQISRKSIYKIICTLICVPTGGCLHLLWTAKLDSVITFGCVYDILKYSYFIKVWGFIEICLTTYLPVLIILISIITISYNRKCLPTCDKNIKMISSDITMMCFVTSLCFVVLNIVSAVLTTCIRHIHNDYKHGPSRYALYEDKQYSNMYVAQSAFILLAHIKKAINLIVFICSGKIFYGEFNLVFCCGNSPNSKTYRYESSIYAPEISTTVAYTGSKEEYDSKSLDAPEAHWHRRSISSKRGSIGNHSTHSQVALIGGLTRKFQESMKSAAILRRQKSNDTASMEFNPLQSSQESLSNILPDEGFIGVFPTDSCSDTSSQSEQHLFPMVPEPHSPCNVVQGNVDEVDVNKQEAEDAEESNDNKTVEHESGENCEINDTKKEDTFKTSEPGEKDAEKETKSDSMQEKQELSSLSTSETDLSSTSPKQKSDLLKNEDQRDTWRESGIVSDSDNDSQNETVYEQNGAEVLRNKLERNVSWASPLVKETRKKSIEFTEEITRF